MEQSVQKKEHKISLDKRSAMSVSGVLEVISFDDRCVYLKTDCGELNIEGEGLKIGTLDTEKGVVALEGRVDVLYYSIEKDKKRGIFKGHTR